MMKLVLAALAATTVIATPAFAQSFGTGPSDTTTITANIAAVCTIDAPAGGTVGIGTNTPIGDISLQCNDPDGYIVTISSANGGVLDDASNANNTTTIPYTLDIPAAGAQLSLTSPVALPHPNGSGTNTLGAQGFTTAASVTVQTPSAATAFAGSYSDVITFSIAAR